MGTSESNQGNSAKIGLATRLVPGSKVKKRKMKRKKNPSRPGLISQIAAHQKY